jgi:hypothetical protein
MSRQGRTLAGQAVLSALILIVVYVTLLRPEDGGSLVGVEAPGGSLGTPAKSREEQRSLPTRDSSNAGRGRASEASAAAVQPSSGEPPPGSDPVGSVMQPPDDQYSDTLSQLRARLASGGSS